MEVLHFGSRYKQRQVNFYLFCILEFYTWFNLMRLLLLKSETINLVQYFLFRMQMQKQRQRPQITDLHE